MVRHPNVSPLLFAAALAIIGMVFPATSQAQDMPSYAQPAVGSNVETITGRINSVEGTFLITLLDDRGFVDSVQLHQGTIINPTGLALEPGMSVTIIGYNAGPAFDANEIDAQYSYAGPYPEPVYYGPGSWYPGFGYGYGPAFSLGLVFVNGGYFYVHRRFHGRPFFGRPFYGRPFHRRWFYDRSFHGRPFSWYGSRGRACCGGAFYGRGFPGGGFYRGGFYGGGFHGGVFYRGVFYGGGFRGGEFHGGGFHGGGFHGGGFHGGGRGGGGHR